MAGAIQMLIRISDFRGRAWLGVVENLAIDVTSASSFIACCIRGKFPRKHRVVPRSSRPISILSSSPTANSLFLDVSVSSLQWAHAAKFGEVNNEKAEEEPHRFRVSREIIINPL